jgi:arylsulfatase A-like enzyme
MSTQGGKPNVLLIIADDLGLDLVKVSGTGDTRKLEVVTREQLNDLEFLEIRGDLPTLSLFLRNGMLFRQAWAQPACSPTRASIYTGLHPWKHGVGSPRGTPEMSSSRSMVTLPEMLPSEYVCGLFGKWHLGEQPGTYPTDHGWDKYQGALGGLLWDRDDPDVSYYNWPRVDSDLNYAVPASYETGYATWVTVRDAANWVNGLDPDTPWFVTIAFNTPHDPFHVPTLSPSYPEAGIGFDPATPGDDTEPPYRFNVMTQNMDHHIGRLVGTVSGSPGSLLEFDPIWGEQLKNTIIIFLGDNGSPPQVAVQEPKVEVYEGGVRVPMIIADGRAFWREWRFGWSGTSPLHLDDTKLNVISSHLVHVVDLFATIVRIADPSASGFPGNIDSHDLGPLFKNAGDQPPIRRYNFSQLFDTKGKLATIRNADYKLNYIHRLQPVEDPYYALYRYDRNNVPGLEDDNADNILDVAESGEDPEASENLTELLDELIGNYQIDETELFEYPLEGS